MVFRGRIGSNVNGRLGFSVCLVALSAFNYGFDNQGFSTTLAMNPFVKQFGVYDAKTGKYELQAYWLSLYSSVIFVGFGVGIIIGSIISARFGRRVSMMVLCTWVLIASAVVISSTNRWQLLAGRILYNGYMGLELATVPVYQAEVVPTPVRGLVVSSYQLSLTIGGLIMNLICLGTQTIPNNSSWRIPYGLFFISPAIVLSGLYWVPESPRWLLIKGRREEALHNLRLLRAGKRTEAEIELELQMTEVALREEPEQGAFKELWYRNNIRRTLTVVGINIVQEMSGQQIISKFGALMVKSIGTISPFVMTVVFASTNLVFDVFTMSMSDRLGRRPLLIASMSTMCAGLMALGAIGTYNYQKRPALAATSIFFLEMVTAGFELGYGPLTNVVMTEVVSLRLRDMSQRTAGFCRVVANFVVGFIIPYLMDDIGLELGFVFGSICFCGLMFTYFCIPECKGKSLEMIERMFQEGIPSRKFGSYKGDLQNLTVENIIDDENSEGREVKLEHLEEYPPKL